MLDAIFPDLKMVSCPRCGCNIFNYKSPAVEKVQFIENGELIQDEIVWYDYCCKECGLNWSE